MKNWISSIRGVLVPFLLFVPSSAFAVQPDAPLQAVQENRQAAWSEENKRIDDKLAALRAKFGKRPNIIYILTDDVGWGELGWQGGGKHRGTPSAELDRMAYEGMLGHRARNRSRRARS
jgi:hypothetical protein